jgi:hypothetical protein
MKGQTGIWIDDYRAIIVHLNEERHWVETLEPQVDYRLRITGHGRSASRLGFCYQSYQEKETEKIRLGRIHFLEAIIERLEPEYLLAIFGPTQIKYEFKKLLGEKPIFSHKPICLIPAGDITPNQFVQTVYSFYGKQLIG